MNEIMEKTNGNILVEELLNETFKKNYRPNHGPDFTGGLEDLHHYYFEKYLSSCGCFLMDMRIVRSDYCG